ncbi:Asp-tRNA(Asn)/Glu-tRNA(Gln) amidotransferase subunit GatC [Puniceicoccales bacterium CK1056]|uniref:Aspartyl/glutamyl-tRNA(Asn/Gln) amidotransferase subunit C n=1 Tax=Oceanipulchritudo coccoides TaxID=2706888 RepID=A0A6B2M0J9_9BACT|nr:Asp-tRNA(Asn)/Glu-tRNA(Gln) amidotransferase subunit GatC [Oceanipulchritudo coccoides]NDV62243.1 Asp-tRNA(Asn)/Glu-tRNA(Gln) amidotransferase subunit GatC [Oceanipulchritudo coccoides]
MQERPEIDIDKLAMLARIHLTEEEKAAFAGQVSDILGFFQKLQEVDVEGIEPMAHPFDVAGPLREDVPGSPWEPSRALKNAPASRTDQIVVPKVVEDA